MQVSTNLEKQARMERTDFGAFCVWCFVSLVLTVQLAQSSTALYKAAAPLLRLCEGILANQATVNFLLMIFINSNLMSSTNELITLTFELGKKPAGVKLCRYLMCCCVLLVHRGAISLMLLPLPPDTQRGMPVACCITWQMPLNIYTALTSSIETLNQRTFW